MNRPISLSKRVRERHYAACLGRKENRSNFPHNIYNMNKSRVLSIPLVWCSEKALKMNENKGRKRIVNEQICMHGT